MDDLAQINRFLNREFIEFTCELEGQSRQGWVSSPAESTFQDAEQSVRRLVETMGVSSEWFAALVETESGYDWLIYYVPSISIAEIIEFTKLGKRELDYYTAGEYAANAPGFAVESGLTPEQTGRLRALGTALDKIATETSSGWRVVQLALLEILRECKFRVDYVDEAGLHATFLKRPTAEQMAWFEAIIVLVDIQALELSDAPPSEMMATEGRLQLWWD